MDGIIQMLPEPLRLFSTHIDFTGQKAAERTFQVINHASQIRGWGNTKSGHIAVK
ncbi:hypothetical protein TELCIR_26296 [Teladorsagia circumcincta]|uniref:Uncharacterized protein n=1 Tax=Teladorsagia circumcincta TaxID=45464 RepID=A0A2G9T3C9_TELCI|nr:hypothetical protein TELCIR_26296 [Teladorsagia circumcincta]